jgi:hypothetical protein
LAVQSDVGDVGGVGGRTQRKGRAVVAVMREVVVDVDVGDVGCGCEKVAPLSHLGCANMTKWSVRSLRYINP